ncbi:MAG: radical SAM protein [Clostridia bacterium]|nr:radical SAM protein [Clostridia bacterium]
MEVLDGPLTVGWDITHMCNLRCKHCYAAAGKIGEKEFSLEEIKSIVDELDKLGTILIALAGGEPLMRKDICEIISYIKGKGIEIFLNTNGTLITEEKLLKLLEAGLTHIEISVDGLEKEHDFIRGEGSFQKVLKTIEICQKYNVKVGIMSTLFKHNIDKIPEFIDFFHNKEVIGIGFLRFIETRKRGK